MRWGIVITVWVLFLALGIWAVPPLQEIGTNLPLQQTDWLALIIQVLGRNYLVLIVLLMGAVTGGLVSLLQLAFLGLIFGIEVGSSVGLFGLGWTASAVLPHGVIEMAGFLVAGRAGLIGLDAWLSYFKGDPELVTAERVRRIAYYALVSFVLVSTAGLLETFITPVLMGG